MCESLAVCCASRVNCIKIHESEFLYLTNCQRSPTIEIFCMNMQKIHEVQQAPSHSLR
jgi:hypothetical protein